MRKQYLLALVLAMLICFNCFFAGGCSFLIQRTEKEPNESESEETTEITSEITTSVRSTTETKKPEPTRTPTPTPVPAPVFNDDAQNALASVISRSYSSFLYREAGQNEIDTLIQKAQARPEAISYFVRSLLCSNSFAGTDYLVDDREFVGKLIYSLFERYPTEDEVNSYLSLIQNEGYNGRTKAIDFALGSSEWVNKWGAFGLVLQQGDLSVDPNGFCIMDYRYHGDNYQLNGTIPDGEYTVRILSTDNNKCTLQFISSIAIDDSAVRNEVGVNEMLYLSLAGYSDLRLSNYQSFDGLEFYELDQEYCFTHEEGWNFWRVDGSSDWPYVFPYGNADVSVSNSFTGIINNQISNETYSFGTIAEFVDFYEEIGEYPDYFNIVILNGQLSSCELSTIW